MATPALDSAANPVTVTEDPGTVEAPPLVSAPPQGERSAPPARRSPSVQVYFDGPRGWRAYTLPGIRITFSRHERDLQLIFTMGHDDPEADERIFELNPGDRFGRFEAPWWSEVFVGMDDEPDYWTESDPDDESVVD